jgi:hypothetical protein
LAIIQSVTFTPAVEVRYVEDATGAPIDGITVTAVWHLYAATPAGSLNSRVLKVHATKTNTEGTVHVPASLMFHPPVFPFGLNVRDINALPILYLNDRRFLSDAAAGSHWDDAFSLSMLTLQKTSIDETTVKLVSSGVQPTRNDEVSEELIDSSVRQARASCRRSRFCQMNEVPQ